MQHISNDQDESTGFSIRPGIPHDVDALYELHKRSVYELCRGHYDLIQLEAIMENRGPDMYLPAISENQLCVAFDQQAILGFVEARPGEILKLFVDPDTTGRGVGRALMDTGITLAKEGNEDAPIRVEATLNAFAFYEQFGFKKTGTGYWSHGNDRIPPIEIVILESS